MDNHCPYAIAETSHPCSLTIPIQVGQAMMGRDIWGKDDSPARAKQLKPQFLFLEVIAKKCAISGSPMNRCRAKQDGSPQECGDASFRQVRSISGVGKD